MTGCVPERSAGCVPERSAGCVPDDLPDEAWVAALAGLPAMGPNRLRAILGQWAPAEAWRRVARGAAISHPEVAAACRADRSAVATAWSRAALDADVAEQWAAYQRAGVGVAVRGSAAFPTALADDQEAPAVLFSHGRPTALAARRAAIVGTRTCTRYGTEVATELGRDLANAGVAVVSGLALGIDGAAHAGALGTGGAAPIAVVGSGLDIVYPRAHAHLWREVGSRGLLLSEAPLGGRPEPWRFPARNRVIAALAEVVIVVESHSRGGSLHTVDAAIARNIPVMAVPGSVRSPASAFPNALLADGCAPVRDALDVLVALGLSSVPADGETELRPSPQGNAVAVLAAVGWEPATLDDVVAQTQLGPGPASLALARLQSDGWVTCRGGWWERVANVIERGRSCP